MGRISLRGAWGSVVAASVTLLLLGGLSAFPAAAVSSDPLVAACVGSGGRASGGGDQPLHIRTDYGLSFDLDAVDPAWWTHDVGASPRQSLDLYSQSWLLEALRYAVSIGDTANVDRAIALAAQSLASYPDNGHYRDFQWNEAATSWRLCAVAAMYHLAPDPRLLPVIEATAAATLDPLRYYGLPHHTPHNHGVMANTALVVAGHVANRPQWIEVAKSRILADSDHWITSAGLGIEQSTSYLMFDIQVWTVFADTLVTLGEPADSALVTRIRDICRRATTASRQLRQPDGRLVVFGDASNGSVSRVPGDALTIIDRGAGIAAGRWSWNEPDDYYAIRFGPTVRAHGHWEHGSLVWWARGRAVLTDPGFDTFAPMSVQQWLRGPSAHSTSWPAFTGDRPRGTMQLVRASDSGARRGFALRGSVWGAVQERTVWVDSANDTLSVSDRAGVAQRQAWQLAPGWRLLWRSGSGHSAVFGDATGGQVVLRTSGRITSVRTGARGVGGGWVYAMRTRQAAPRVEVTSAASTVTTWSVSGPPLRPWG